MKIYIKEHKSHAGKWIYAGYKSAWKHLGYDVEYYSNLDSVVGKNYYLMVMDADVNFGNISRLENADKVFLHAQPNKFPLPWGSHPNFISHCPTQIVPVLNKMDNIHKWSFGLVTEFHEMWEDVHEIPLAFDSINYNLIENKKYEFDVCYIGGWADNGFNEKRKILIDHLLPFKDAGLKCGFFIDKNVSHDDENLILSNSKIAINIHDAYQRVLGLDTNERTFKSLGLTGLLISDRIEHISKYFEDIPMCAHPSEMVDLVKEYVNLPSEKILQLKEKNRKGILEKHTYINRVQHMEAL